MAKKLQSRLPVALLAAAFLAVVLTGCGGGGGSTPQTSGFPARSTATVTGEIDSITVDSGYTARAVDPASRETARTAGAVTITDFSDFTVTINGVAGEITGNTYTVRGVPKGKNLLVKISKGKLMLKAYVPTTDSDATVTKAVSLESTAAAVLWEELGKPEDTSVASLESEYASDPTNAKIKDIVDNLETAFTDASLAASLGTGESVLDAPDVKEVIEEAKQGEDTTAPTIFGIFPDASYTAVDPSVTRIKILFNEAMDSASTVTGVSVDIKNTTSGSATTTVSAPTLSWGIDDKTLVIDHATTLDGSSDYTIVVTLNPSSIKDKGGNALSIPSTVPKATVNTTANTITVSFSTNFTVSSWTAPTETEHTASEIGTADTTFVKTFSGGATIATSGATYVGMTVCQTCHSSLYTSYAATNHSQAFATKVTTMRATCVSCHTVDGPKIPDWSAGGAKPVRTAANGAFGLTATTYAAVADVPTAMQNIQCENCHGPGSLHVAGSGDVNYIVSGTQASAGATCDVCHDSPDHHMRSTEWRKSKHSSNYKRNSASCKPCHTGEGFVEFTERIAADSTAYILDGKAAVTYTGYSINCATCHDPHQKASDEDKQPAQLRLPKEDLCISCHNGRKKKPGDSRAPHHNVQGRVLMGESGMTSDGKMYWNSDASDTPPSGVTTTTAYGPSMGSSITCVDCHMADHGHGPTHTFAPSAEACGECHTGMDGAASIGYKQAVFKNKYDPVKARLDLATADSAGFTADQKTLYNNAMWNLNYVDYDGSKGVHNSPYVLHLIDEASKMLTTLGY